MNINNAFWLVMFLCLTCSCKRLDVPPPQPYGPVPSPSQVEWQKMEYYMFVHFGPNSFTGKEWGDGKEDPGVFNPSNLDCRQWAATAKAAGMKGIIITAKHHDGFCLWPSKYSSHTVRESAWKEGKGDALKELSDACREYGLKFGVYLSPWDRNHPDYGTPAYNQVFANTLEEVLTGYGEVFEQWFDGANGEGKDGKKQVYDWDLFHQTVYKHQPGAIIFSDIGPGCRWIGNEQGFAGETNWSRLDIEGFEPGSNPPPLDTLNRGNKHGEAWVPGETDVSIRPGWFYSPTTDDQVKSVDRLLQIYLASVGRNSNLLLNVPPDRSGRIHPVDSARLMELRSELDKIFSVNLAGDAVVTASSTRSQSRLFHPANLVDENYDTYWAVGDSVLKASILMEWNEPRKMNYILLQEYIPLGQRVARFNIEYWNEKTGSWTIFAEASTIGYKRVLQFPAIETAKIRINIQDALACPTLSEIGLYYEGQRPGQPEIHRNRAGDVSINAQPGVAIYYTVDGSEPSIESIKYSNPFFMPEPGVVKAIAWAEGEKSGVAVKIFDISPHRWKVLPVDRNIQKAIDNDLKTAAWIRHSQPLVIDFGEALQFRGVFYEPDGNHLVANIYRYNLFGSLDGTNWNELLKDGSFANIKNNPVRQEARFENAAIARFIKLEPLELTIQNDHYSVREFGIIAN